MSIFLLRESYSTLDNKIVLGNELQLACKEAIREA